MFVYVKINERKRGKMARVEIIKPNLKTENVNVSLKKKYKVGAYARVSTDSEEQLTSYESQIRYYTEKIKANPEWEFVDIYADEGISGTRVKNRTEFLRMIDDAMNGKLDIIITKSISRFARNVVDTLKYVRELRDKKVDVYFEKENIHTLQLDSEMFLTLYSAFAQAESESTSQNVTMGFKAKMKNGEPVGRANPYGYDWNKETKELIINEEEAEIVKQIFTWYCDGIGTRIIANRLNEMGIKSPGGKKWAQQYVRTMISQEKYVGDLLGQKNYTISPITHKKVRNYGEKEQYYVKDHHEAIISREVWNKAQEILEKRRNKIIPNGKQHFGKFSQRYTFSSMIECGFCETNFSRRVSGKRKNGSQVVYWSCYNKVLNVDNCPDALIIREELLQSAFVELHNSIVKNKYKTKDLMLKAIKETLNEKDYKKKLDNLNNEKNTLENRLSNLIDMKLDDYSNKEAYTSKEKEINEKLDLIKEEIANCEMLENENKNLSKQIKIVEELFEEPTLLKEFDDLAFSTMVKKIIVGGYDENGNKNSKIIRFVLNTGEEKPFILADKKGNKELVSFELGDRELFARCWNNA